MNESERHLTESVRKTLEQSVEALPAEVRSRLARARQQALAAAETPRGSRVYPWLLPASGFAAVLLTLALWQGSAPPRLPLGGAESVAAQDLEILLSAEDLELVEELDFLLWLQEQTDAG